MCDIKDRYSQKLKDKRAALLETIKALSLARSPNQAHLVQMNDMLTQTEQALLRLQNGSFGTCQNCGELVEDDRLVVIPYAELCLICQRQKEHREIP